MNLLKIAAVCAAFVLLLIVLIGTFRTVFEPYRPFFRKFTEETCHAYYVLTIVAVAILIWALLPAFTVESVEVAGLKLRVQTLQQRVDTLTSQMEAFFQRKRIQEFDKRNWGLVRVIRRTPSGGYVLEVALAQEPIPNSVEVFEGVLPMPEQDYKIEGRELQFPANSDKPDVGITVKYYPRIVPPS